MMILKQAPLPEDILMLGVEGVNQIWRDAKIRKRAQTLIEAAKHSVGTKEGATAARIEIRMLLEDYESRNERLQEIIILIENLVKQIPVAEKPISRRGRKRQRYLLFEATMSLVGKNPEFRELHHYYTTRKLNPLKKM